MLQVTSVCSKISRDFLRRASTATNASNNNEISPYLYNRNPRNLERLRIARKPQGYALDDVPTNYWNR